MSNTKNISAKLAGVLLVLLAAAAPARAHPFHVSIAEMEWNERSSRLEVAVKVLPEDLERALRRKTRRHVVLERTADIDRLIHRYLSEAFVVTNHTGKPARLHWVGKEISPKEAWLYFEVAMPAGLDRARITNRLLFGMQKDQVNTLILRTDGKRTSLSFSRQQPTQMLSGPKKDRRTRERSRTRQSLAD